jgi:hypothetical protein
MVDLMHAGADQSPVGSTITFVSDTSVPLRTCHATAAALFGKVLVGTQMKLYPSGSTLDVHASKVVRTPPVRPAQCKSTQWMSLPRQVWLDHYRPYLFRKRQAVNLLHNGTRNLYAPDEWWMQSELCLNDTLRPALNYTRLQHARGGQRIGEPYGLPRRKGTKVAMLAPMNDLSRAMAVEHRRAALAQRHPLGLRLTNTHKVIWGSKHSAHPETFTVQQYEEAQREGYLFIRKYNVNNPETLPENLHLARASPTIEQLMPASPQTMAWQHISHLLPDQQSAGAQPAATTHLLERNTRG